MVKLSRRTAAQQGLEIIARYTKALASAYSGRFLFRGHANSEWKPVAHAFRPGVDGLVYPQSLQAWIRMAQRLANPRPSNEIEYLVLAQHYGIPTALLDWTSNPLVALFFACTGTEGSKAGQVICVDQAIFKDGAINGLFDPLKSSRDQPILFDTSALNIRSMAQDSYMSLHVKNEPPLPYEVVFNVPSDLKYTVRSALSIFGLTPERVYVDLAVAASRFSEDLGWDNILYSDP